MAKTLTVREILTYLLNKKGMSEVSLGREIGVPRATINRITSGRTVDPRASTLNAIAAYFNIGTEQLLGLKPILLEKEQAMPEIAPIIPLLAWHEAKDWLAAVTVFNQNDNTSSAYKINNTEGIDADFALNFKGESMSPQFQENTLLLISTRRQARNHDFVIAYLKEQDDIVFRKLVIENKYKILKAINHIFPPIELGPTDKIIGTIIQTRTNY